MSDNSIYKRFYEINNNPDNYEPLSVYFCDEINKLLNFLQEETGYAPDSFRYKQDYVIHMEKKDYQQTYIIIYKWAKFIIDSYKDKFFFEKYDSKGKNFHNILKYKIINEYQFLIPILGINIDFDFIKKHMFNSSIKIMKLFSGIFAPHGLKLEFSANQKKVDNDEDYKFEEILLHFMVKVREMFKIVYTDYEYPNYTKIEEFGFLNIELKLKKELINVLPLDMAGIVKEFIGGEHYRQTEQNEKNGKQIYEILKWLNE